MAKTISKSAGRLILGLTISVLLFALALTITFVVADRVGNPSSVAGKSAYEIAVDNGFKGTEAEWLESLKTGTEGTAWHTGKGLPDASVAAKEGDFYINLNTNSVYAFENGKWSFVSNMGGSANVSPWDGTIPGWQNPNLSEDEIIANRPVSYVVDDEKKTVEIHNADAFAWFAYRSVIGVAGYEGWTVSLKSDIDLAGNMWVPIGLGARSNAAGTAFKGVFDGEGHTIYNLSTEPFYESIHYGEFDNLLTGQKETGWYSHIENNYLGNDVSVDIALNFKLDKEDTANNAKYYEFSFGLFGSAYDATIKNLNIENVKIEVAQKEYDDGNGGKVYCVGDSVGALVGFAQYNLTVENCRVGYKGCTGVVSGAKSAGGLVGRFYGGKYGDGKWQVVDEEGNFVSNSSNSNPANGPVLPKTTNITVRSALRTAPTISASAW